MVGVPKSTGCQLCRKRRVKCDEVKPGCGNCARYGAECPGYERALKFVSGKHAVRPKGSAKSASASSSAGSSPASWSVRLSSEGSSSPARSISVARSPSPVRSEFVVTMVQTAKDAIMSKDMTGFFSWMQLGKVGGTAGLDGALCSLSMHIVGKNVGDHAMIAHSRTLYGQSLTELQRLLQHGTKWRDPDTLCVAILLCIFELFAGTGSSHSWLQHARGIGSLIEQRGPEAHADGWDAAMLLSFRGVLIMADLFFPEDRPSFLSRPEWQTVMRDNRRRLIHPAYMADDAIDAIDEYNCRLAHVPEVIRLGYPALQAAQKGEPPDPVCVAAVRPVATRCYSLLREWHSIYGHVLTPGDEVLSEDPDSLYVTVLSYPVTWIGTLQISYWATMLLVQGMLQAVGSDAGFASQQVEFVNGILRSLEHLSQGPLGPYRVGYAVRVAYEVASSDAQAWIRKMLDKFTKTYAAVDKATYPEPRQDRDGYP